MEPEIKEEAQEAEQEMGEPIFVEMNAIVHGKSELN